MKQTISQESQNQSTGKDYHIYVAPEETFNKNPCYSWIYALQSVNVYKMLRG